MSYISGVGRLAATPEKITALPGTEQQHESWTVTVYEDTNRKDETGEWVRAGTQTWKLWLSRRMPAAALTQYKKGSLVMFSGELRISDRKVGQNSYHQLSLSNAMVGLIPTTAKNTEDGAADSQTAAAYEEEFEPGFIS